MTNEKPTGESWIDPDDAPKLTAEWFEGADLYHGGKLIRRGRPKSASAKQHVSLRLDPEVIRFFKDGGDGWQSRVNAALRKAAGL